MDRPTWTWWLQNVSKAFLLAFFLFLFKIIIFFMQQSVKGSGLLQVSSRNSSYPTPTCEGMKSSIRLNCDSPEVVSKQTTSKLCFLGWICEILQFTFPKKPHVLAVQVALNLELQVPGNYPKTRETVAGCFVSSNFDGWNLGELWDQLTSRWWKLQQFFCLQIFYKIFSIKSIFSFSYYWWFQ